MVHYDLKYWSTGSGGMGKGNLATDGAHSGERSDGPIIGQETMDAWFMDDACLATRPHLFDKAVRALDQALERHRSHQRQRRRCEERRPNNLPLGRGSALG